MVHPGFLKEFLVSQKVQVKGKKRLPPAIVDILNLLLVLVLVIVVKGETFS